MALELTRNLIEKLPKTDLHLHLGGSIRPLTLIELARETGVALPSYSEQGLLDTLFTGSYGSLEAYLRCFVPTSAVLRNREAISRAAYELAVDNQNEGVRYIEVRFAPQLHVSRDMDVVEVFNAVNEGLGRAKSEFNRRPEIVSGDEPPFDYGLVACAMRSFSEESSPYYLDFIRLHRYSDLEQVRSLAALETAQAAVYARDMGVPVVGFDLSGPEHGYPAMDYRDAFSYVHRHFLHKTVHAGEAYGPESIFQAITELHADRIGHGTSLLNPGAVTDPRIKNPHNYVRDLAQFIADRRVTIEVCLTSNQHTSPAYKDLFRHPFGKMFAQRLSVTICTDNRTVSRTTVTDELYKAVKTFDLSLADLKSIVVYGFKRSFFPGDYALKREYVRRCMEYFEKVAEMSAGPG